MNKTNKLLGWIVALLAVFGVMFFVVNKVAMENYVNEQIERVLPADDETETEPTV